MENLRWIMLGIGLAVILLIYFVGRSRSRPELHDYQEPLAADEMPSISTSETEEAVFDSENEFAEPFDQSFDMPIDEPIAKQVDDVLENRPAYSKDDDFKFVASEINQFELNDELVDEVTASVDDGLVDVITSGASAKTKRNETTEQPEHGQTQQSQESPRQDTIIEESSSAVDENESYDDDLIVMHIEAREAYFSGLDLLRVINHQQLKFGDMNIYHAYDEIGETIFSMSNMLKPGHFEPEHFSEMRTPGVILFMQLSLVPDQNAALDRMLFCADTLSKELGAQITSASRQRLVDTDIEAFRKKANYYSQTTIA